MKHIWFGILLASCAAVAAAECRPEGHATFVAGLEALARGDLSLAAVQFTNLVQAQPDCAAAHNNLAVVEVEQGRLKEGEEELHAAVRLRPDYGRARLNLRHVEALLAGQAQPTSPPALPPIVLSPVVTPESTAVLMMTATPQPTETPPRVGLVAPPPAPAAANQAAASGIVALEPLGATACAIDVARQRVCLYNRTAQAVMPRACYPFAGFQVATWPWWLIAGDSGRQRIRCVDETGRPRLKIIPEHARVAGDALRLRQNDFDSLSASVTPWRTACVVADSAGQLEPAMPAAVRDALEAWRSAWGQRRLEDYVAHYSRTFVPQSDRDVAHWRARKQHLFADAGSFTVQLASPSIFVSSDGATVITLFDQRYRSGTTAAHDLKALRWQRDAGVWKITAETVLRPNPPE